jgi:hypothetical protein
METPYTNSARVADHLYKEVDEVHAKLLVALAELASPLGELVRSQLAHSLSPARIGLLLAAARGQRTSEQAHQQRILLSSSLEMLYLAINIHKLLLNYPQNNGDHQPERAWTGSIILAGDYCFSRSASLAAQTNLPRVVDIFASALKAVNEELLRRLFAATDRATHQLLDEEAELIGAGLRAATVVAQLDRQTANATVDYGQKLIKQLTTTPLPTTQSQELPATLAAFQRPYWQAWLALYKLPTAQ